jgi:ubiquitin C-terminal hydrolase
MNSHYMQPFQRPIQSQSQTQTDTRITLVRSLLLLAILFSSCHENAASLSTPNKTKSKSRSNDNILVSGGLVNLGNTCYLNAQLECAYHIPYLRHIVLNPIDTTSEECPPNRDNIGLLSLRQQFQSMEMASKSGLGDPITTRSVSTSILCRNLGINVYEQQDSQEFWKLLLPELDYPPLSELYRGTYQSFIAALDGSGREKTRSELFLDLSLDVSNFDNAYDSLDDLLTSGEILSEKEGNGWRPEKGAEKVDALKGNSIACDGLPKVLQLHLMRFTFDWQTQVMSKINDRFSFTKVRTNEKWHARHRPYSLSHS